MAKIFKKTGKHLWKHKRKYGVGVGAISAYALGAVTGMKTYASIENYNPQTSAQLKKIKRDQDRYFKRKRRIETE